MSCRLEMAVTSTYGNGAKDGCEGLDTYLFLFWLALPFWVQPGTPPEKLLSCLPKHKSLLSGVLFFERAMLGQFYISYSTCI